MDISISRRNLFKASGVAAAGVVGASLLTGCQKEGAVAVKDWKDKKCVQIGDSITWYDGNTTPKGDKQVGYASYLRSIFKEVDNKAVSGAAIAYHSESKYEDVSQTVDNVNFADYDFCTIAAGLNDCQYQFSPMGSLTKENFDKTTFYGGYQYILNKIYKDNPGIQLMMVTPLKSKKINTPEYKNKLGYNLMDYVKAVREIAEVYSIPLLDFYEIGGFNDYTFDTYTIDGLHPNNTGFEMLSRKMVSFIQGL